MLNRWISLTLCLFIAGIVTSAQNRSVHDLYTEIDKYSSARTEELSRAGKKITADTRKDITAEKRSLAGKYAAEASTRGDLEKADLYYLGLLHAVAGEEEKHLDAM